MAKNSKVRVDRVIILVLVAILVLGVLGFGIYSLFGLLFKDKPNNNNNNNPIVNPVVDTTNGVKVSLVDYTIYEDDTNDLGFNFIIAELSFTANNPVSFEFKNLQTSEKVILNNVSEYINKMELAGYKFDELQINTTGVSSQENKINAKLFIPFKTDAYSLCVYNAVDASKIEFNLSENNKPATSLKLEDTEQVIEVQGAKVEVSNSYISSSMYHNDIEYTLGSTQKIFTFRINAHDIEQGVKIVKAQFLKKGESEPIDCLSSGYCSEKDDNAIDQVLNEGDNGALFFEMRTNEIKPDFSGILLITFSNSDKVYEIPTVYE